MISRKYMKDYSVEYDETPGGRLKARAVYVGGDYAFVDTITNVRKTAAYFTVLTVAAWCAYIASLLVVSAAGRTYYVIVPHGFAFLPLMGMSCVIFDLWTEKPPFTREKSDRISRRAPASAASLMILSGIAAAGLVVRFVSDPASTLMPGDLIFGLCEAVLLAASCLLFRGRKRTATRLYESD